MSQSSIIHLADLEIAFWDCMITFSTTKKVGEQPEVIKIRLFRKVSLTVKSWRYVIIHEILNAISSFCKGGSLFYNLQKTSVFSSTIREYFDLSCAWYNYEGRGKFCPWLLPPLPRVWMPLTWFKKMKLTSFDFCEFCDTMPSLRFTFHELDLHHQVIRPGPKPMEGPPPKRTFVGKCYSLFGIFVI